MHRISEQIPSAANKCQPEFVMPKAMFFVMHICIYTQHSGPHSEKKYINESQLCGCPSLKEDIYFPSKSTFSSGLQPPL